jgi:cytochrome c
LQVDQYPYQERVEVKFQTALLVAILGAACAGNAMADEKLAQAKNCLACHQIDTKLVGPAYKDVAAKYKDDKDAEARLTKKVMAGGTGVWGQIPMPPNPNPKDDEIGSIVQWILGGAK